MSRIVEMDKLVGERLKLKRLVNGLSQKQIAIVLGISIQQIQKYEKGINRVSAGKLYILAEFLKLPIESFFSNNSIDTNITSNNNKLNKEIINLIINFQKIESEQARKSVIAVASSFVSNG